MTLPPMDILDKASQQVSRPVTFIRSQEKTICPNFISNYLQLKRIAEAEKKLLYLYTNSFKLHQYIWSSSYPPVNTQAYVERYMSLDAYDDDNCYKELTKCLRFTDITVKPIINDYSEIAKSVMGVGIPNQIVVPALKPNLIQCPETGFGLISLPRKNDFIIMVKSSFDELSVLEQSLNEMRDISAGKMSSRAGAAGGMMLPNSHCKSLSPVTKNDRVLCTRENSVGMSVTYRNKDGLVKGRNAIYKDLLMTRNGARKKFRNMLKSVALQRLTITEMISRLKSFMLLDFKKIIPIAVSLKGFMHMSLDRIEMETMFREIGRSPLESKLLSWACSTGEMRNHESVKAHFDGNKSHPVETMSLFGRVSINAKNLSIETVKSMEDGYLLLPLEGVTIKIQCGYDLIHCSLKSTLHLADNTRNTCNWSRVHGP